MPRHWQSTFPFLALVRMQPGHMEKLKTSQLGGKKSQNGRNSKSTMDECTLLIKLLLEHYSLDPSINYVKYPDKEMEDSSSDPSDSSQEEDEDEYEGNEGNSDLDGQL